MAASVSSMLVVDVALVAGLLVLAWRVLRERDLYVGCVLFIAFGLLMALVWVRLEATDVALVEAALGSGVTGALLLAALRRLSASAADAPRDERGADRADGAGDA